MQEAPGGPEGNHGGIGAGRKATCVHDASPLVSSWTPGIFYTYFYAHAHRLRLENYYIWSFLEAPTDFFNHFWIQVAVLLLEPPHGGFRIETAVT
jgi:hypothetical protein